MAPRSVLLVNHTTRISGGERSLLDLLRGLSAHAIDLKVACPEGDLSEAVERLHVPVHPITGTDGSLKLHPRHTPTALAELTRATIEVRRLARRLRVDLVHANSIRAGIVASGRRGGTPLVAHVRDHLPPGLVSRASLGVIGARADLIAANSAYTAGSLPASVQAKVRVVANPVDLARFDPDRVERASARHELGVEGGAAVLTVVAQVTPWKGQEEAIRMVAGLRDRDHDVRLLVVGDMKFTSGATRYDNQAYRARLEVLLDELAVRDRVVFTGEREDVPAVLRATDVLLVPSWEEPFGRTVIEGMAMGLPVVATNVGGPAEIIEDGRTGLLAPPREVEAWIDAIASVLGNDDRRSALGRHARARARDFGLAAHVDAVLALYDELTLPGGPA